MYDIVMHWIRLLQKIGFYTKPKSNFISGNGVFFEPPSTGNILSETVYILQVYVETGYVLIVY